MATPPRELLFSELKFLVAHNRNGNSNKNDTMAVLRLVWPATVFHRSTAAVCARSRCNRRRNCERVTAMERHVRKTAYIIL